MANPPEFWTFAVANLLTFGLGTILTGVSFYAYTTKGRRSLRDATIGFGTLTLGMIVEPLYQFGVRGDYALDGRELLALQTLEGMLLSIGLGLLFYSIYRRNRGVRRSRSEPDAHVRDPGDSR